MRVISCAPTRCNRDASGVLAFKTAPVGGFFFLGGGGFGPFCWQAFVPPGTPPLNEGCLKINVWTSALEKTDKRPVMFWIHGGSFKFRSSEDPRHDGAHMVRKGVVVVSINYCQGVFGYLALL